MADSCTMSVNESIAAGLAAYYGLFSVVLFSVYGWDKAAAQRQGRRIRERIELTGVKCHW